jgi:hypothetical protein
MELLISATKKKLQNNIISIDTPPGQMIESFPLQRADVRLEMATAEVGDSSEEVLVLRP